MSKGGDTVEKLYIAALGGFSITKGCTSISDSKGRSKKIWQLIAYLFFQKGRVVPRNELIDVLWGNDTDISNPENTLKVTLLRARKTLDELYDNAGHSLIIHKSNGYCWNTEIPFTADTEVFEQLCRSSYKNEDEYITNLSAAVALYKGNFLENHSYLTWVIPIQTYFHALYTDTILSLCPFLSKQLRYEDVISICSNAIIHEPYHEKLHCMLMDAYISTGKTKKAESIYNKLASSLKNDFGISPERETKELFLKATQKSNDRKLSVDTVIDHVNERLINENSAIETDYEVFKALCFVEGRNMQRNGNESHISLLSITSRNNKDLEERMNTRAAELLKETIAKTLRRSDCFTQASSSQFIILLKNANYENSCMVTNRIIGEFYSRNPHSPAKINFMVKTLSPDSLD